MTYSAASLHRVSHHYGARAALTDVSFDIAAGQFLALLGPNGAGKTTLFSILTRLLRPDHGDISIFGHDLTRQSGKALAQLGVVFQQPTLDLDLSVQQNLTYHAAIQGLKPSAAREGAKRELTRFGLWDRRTERVRALNGGHRRRVEIARALLHRPKLLLLDEASAGLDLETRSALYRYVRTLCDEEGLAVLWTTHLVEELGHDDQAILIKQGVVQAQGSLAQLVSERGVADANALVLELSGGNH